MIQCQHCEGFVPAQLSHCPHCDTRKKVSLKQRFRLAAQVMLGASVTMTLAACYGAPIMIPPCEDGKNTATDSKGSPIPCRPTSSPSGSPSASASPAASASPSASASPTSTATPGT